MSDLQKCTNNHSGKPDIDEVNQRETRYHKKDYVHTRTIHLSNELYEANGLSASMIRYCDKGKTNTGLKKYGCPKSCACTTGSCQVRYKEDSFN